MKKCTFIANYYLAYAYFALISVMFLSVILSFFMDTTAGYLMLALWLFLVFIACCITDRWCLLITIEHDGLYYKPLFRKGAYVSYANYPRIQHAYYMHGGVVLSYKVHFFVFTNKRLNDWELTHINDVAPSADLLKIRYTIRTYKKIISVLPVQQAKEVIHIYTSYIQ